MLLFTAGLALLPGVLAGIRRPRGTRLRTPRQRRSGKSAWQAKRNRGGSFGQSLVVAQADVVAGVVDRGGHIRLPRLQPGAHFGFFERDSVLLVMLDPARSGYQREQLSNLDPGLLERLETIPGVRSASLSALTPTARGAGRHGSRPWRDSKEKPEDRRYLSLNWVGPRYIRDGLYAAAGGA